MSTDAPKELATGVISKAMGQELRRAREARGWTRQELVESLPSKIGDRTLLSYEHGIRQMTLSRFAELSWALSIDAPTMFARGLQRARILVYSSTLEVDLHALLRDERPTFRPLRQWASNALNEHPNGIVQVEPAVVRNLALFIGCDKRELAEHFARFTPDALKGQWPTFLMNA